MTTEEIAEEIRGVLHALDTFCPGSQYGFPDCEPGKEQETVETLLAELGGWIDILINHDEYCPDSPSRCHRAN